MNTPQPQHNALAKPSILGVPRTAAAEIVVFFAAALVFDAVVLDGTRFREINPHPFWLFLLVMAAHYGTPAGIFATVLGTLVAYAGNLPPRDPLQNQSAYLLGVLGRPVLWFASAVVIGELRTRQERARLALQQRLSEVDAQNASLALANVQLEQANTRLQAAAAGQVQTAVSLVEAAASVERQQSESVFASVDGLITTLLTPNAYSIYLNAGDHMHLVVQTNDGKVADAVPRYDRSSALFEAVVSRCEVVHVATKDGQKALGKDGVLAGPLMDVETGRALGMLKVEAMPMQMLKQDTLHAFRALCEWIGSAYRNAQKFEEANRQRVSHPHSQLFTDAFYQPVAMFVVALAERARFEVAQLTVRLTRESVREGDAVPSVEEIVVGVLTQGLRSTDLAFDYQALRNEYVVLLPLTPTSNCQAVADRLRALTLAQLQENGHQVQVAVTFESLYVPTPSDVKPWHRPVFRRTAPYAI